MQKYLKMLLRGNFIDINYEVPADEYFKNPKKQDGSLKLPYQRFCENKNLRRMDNGFVVFTENIFADTKKQIDLK